MDYYVPENMIEESKHTSESGNYYMFIRFYKAEGSIVTRGIVYNRENKQLCDIKRNNGDFFHCFVVKDKEEWLITGTHYLSQTIVNLNTGYIFDNSANADQSNFFWTSVYPSPNGCILAVKGFYIETGVNEIQFYDFTDIETNGLLQYPIKMNVNLTPTISMIDRFDAIDTASIRYWWTDKNTFYFKNDDKSSMLYPTITNPPIASYGELTLTDGMMVF